MCFYEIAVGQLKQALSYCETCQQQLGYNNQVSANDTSLKALCMMARAIIEFNKGNFKASLASLKQMITANPKAPSDVWFALSLCYQRLEQYPKAKIGMKKVLELEPEHSMALVCLGILEIKMNINDKETRMEAAKLFQRSFESNPRNVLTLKYLGEHFCLKGDHEVARNIANAGL